MWPCPEFTSEVELLAITKDDGIVSVIFAAGNGAIVDVRGV